MITSVVKPRGITSHDVVNEIRKITGERRVGHGGTLDPFAEGVLVIAISRESTKKLGEILLGADKEYLATIELGKTSSTGDPEGKIQETTGNSALRKITERDVENVLNRFRGQVTQTPPVYSAVKVRGIPAYKRTRAGEKVTLKKRKVFVKELELVEFDPPLIKLRTVVSSGTYIRSLAEDIGKALGVGAYTKELIRTRVGSFLLENSKTLQELKKSL
ncbi:MAG: tRNA pseudouridine(55) synthase TruB [Candidatus Colwellbacteria bacterium RIFCSPLOWO2_12_FULL_46_17]|uniref:tRNA pseudouridine synthase B n=2 Tax=Candidatus Colwelliibacteriota TaxID=1817904 RepID=A0A1G1ZDK5_9BACT|nr:MAG: tRNA pseudouridine(55) synthase TruB [Candidatus Colwellbacteria bacterium RIFCSPLOWO2_02_FULL_45_11]OGY62644.1 MAG: tRNA pseudouridine(55) synthase TruB [Candidatus Colwellbacteria bacterium RIFCSPLOWO2_12_FULL_46_17]